MQDSAWIYYTVLKTEILASSCVVQYTVMPDDVQRLRDYRNQVEGAQ